VVSKAKKKSITEQASAAFIGWLVENQNAGVTLEDCENMSRLLAAISAVYIANCPGAMSLEVALLANKLQAKNCCPTKPSRKKATRKK
jgi:hypothetical protein